jgi:hypothetical protein
MDRNRPVKVHNFPDAVSGEHLYAYTQCTDGVLDGDVFVGKDIGIVGYMTEAWPVAVTVEVGGLHTLLAESFFDEDYAHQYGESIRIAVGEAKRLGFAVDPDFTDMIGRTARRHTASDDHYDGPPEYEDFYENFDEGAEDDFQLWADDNDIPEERRDDPDVRQQYADLAVEWLIEQAAGGKARRSIAQRRRAVVVRPEFLLEMVQQYAPNLDWEIQSGEAWDPWTSAAVIGYGLGNNGVIIVNQLPGEWAVSVADADTLEGDGESLFFVKLEEAAQAAGQIASASHIASRRTAESAYEMDDMDLVDNWLLGIGLGLFGEDSYTNADDARASGEKDCRATVEAEGLQPTEVEDVMYAARRRATEADEAGIPLMVAYWEGVASCAQSVAGA